MLTLSISAHAESSKILIGCAYPKFVCSEDHNKTKQCLWTAAIGNIVEVELSKTGNGSAYEIWEGKFSNLIENKFHFTISIYQRRESKEIHNFMSASMEINNLKVLAQGENTVEVRYLSELENFGVGVHCTVNISPLPDDL
jgi:hypothetical protein